MRTAIANGIIASKKEQKKQKETIDMFQKFLDGNKISIRKLLFQYNETYNTDVSYQSFIWKWNNLKLNTEEIENIKLLIDNIKKELLSYYKQEVAVNPNIKYRLKNKQGKFLVQIDTNDYILSDNETLALTFTKKSDAEKRKSKLYNYKLLIDEVQLIQI